MPPYTSMMNHYARAELGYETDTEYHALSREVNEKWEHPRGQYPDTSETLRSAFAKNPFMKLFVGQGYYDLATVHFAAQYTLDHMDISPDLRSNIQLHYYEAGHMFYLDAQSLAKLKQDVAGFIDAAIENKDL
jgi:carboxypeptidase C (cathepsin A)